MSIEELFALPFYMTQVAWHDFLPTDQIYPVPSRSAPCDMEDPTMESTLLSLQREPHDESNALTRSCTTKDALHQLSFSSLSVRPSPSSLSLGAASGNVLDGLGQVAALAFHVDVWKQFPSDESDSDLLDVLFTNTSERTRALDEQAWADAYTMKTSKVGAATSSSLQWQGIIKREFEMLSDEDMIQYKQEVQESRGKELGKLFDLQCFARMPRSQAKNVLDCKWVYKWKLIDGKKAIKSRITLRGFRENHMSFETFAGTASRHAQRLVNAMVVTHANFVLEAWDISSAFAQGLQFEEIANLTGQRPREVQLALNPEDIPLVQSQAGFETFNPLTEVLNLKKAVYGLKDAPRAWELRLRQLLQGYGLRQSTADQRLYLQHDAQGHLLIACSTHVDDIKVTGHPECVDNLARHLSDHVGKLQREKSVFLHTGLKHELRNDGLYVHQNHYITQIHPAVVTHLRQMDPTTSLSMADAAVFMSLLGALAWLGQTRPDVLVHIQALQRHGHAPRKMDLLRANAVLKYVKKRSSGLWYPRMSKPRRLIVFSDAAFRARPDEASGLALKGLAIGLTDAGRLHGDIPFHLIEFQSNRQRRVVRSTFAAELNALLDATERAYHVQLLLHELLHGVTCASGRDMLQVWRQGRLLPPIATFVDARSVFDAISASDLHVPQEDSLLLHLTALREDLAVKKIQTLCWVDTRSMLADGLTKGATDKTQLHLASDGGRLSIPIEHLSLHSARQEAS